MRGKPRLSGRGALNPTLAQERMMRFFVGACRFVYNEALALRKNRYQNGERYLGYAELCKLLTAWRNGEVAEWLVDAPSQAQ